MGYPRLHDAVAAELSSSDETHGELQNEFNKSWTFSLKASKSGMIEEMTNPLNKNVGAAGDRVGDQTESKSCVNEVRGSFRRRRRNSVLREADFTRNNNPLAKKLHDESLSGKVKI